MSIVCGVLASWPLLFPAPSRVLPIFSFFQVLAMGLILLGSIGSCGSLIRQRAFRLRLLGCIVLMSLGVQALWFQRATDIGLFVLGGTSYWVDRAARAEDEVDKRNAIGVALEGTEYALKLTEQRILEVYANQPEVQAELFRILAEKAYVDSRRERYMELSEHFETISTTP